MLWLLLLVLLVVLYQSGVFNKLLNSNQLKSNQATEKSALDVLNERYARGEVSTDEYEQIKTTINKNH